MKELHEIANLAHSLIQMVIVYNIGSHLGWDTSPCVWAMLQDSREWEADSQRRTCSQTDVSSGSTAADLLLRTHRHLVRTSRGKSLRPSLRTQPTKACHSDFLQTKIIKINIHKFCYRRHHHEDCGNHHNRRRSCHYHHLQAYNNKSNSTAGVVQVEAYYLQAKFSDFLQCWPWKCRPRSKSTTFAMIPFDGIYIYIYIYVYIYIYI